MPLLVVELVVALSVVGVSSVVVDGVVVCRCFSGCYKILICCYCFFISWCCCGGE